MRASIVRGVVALMVAGSSLAVAQPVSVEFDLRLPNYDVIYLSDLVDIRNVVLSDNIPDMSIEMFTVPRGQTLRVYLRVRAAIQLRGDAQPEPVVRGETNDFDLIGSRRLSSKDLSGGGGVQGIRVRTTYKLPDNSQLRKKLEDYIQRFPTAPVGRYFFEIEVYSAVNRTQKLGEISRVINVRNSSESEVVITLVSPEQGAAVPTPFPTFSWSSEKSRVTLYVYEKLRIHRSPEEAVTGIPYLKRELSGASTFTYPADALRRLEIGKRYYWFVETEVLTTRGSLKRQSEIRMFRVQPQAGGGPLARFLSTLPGEAAGEIAQLIQEGWTPTSVSLDGKPVNQGELAALFQQFIRENTEVMISIED